MEKTKKAIRELYLYDNPIEATIKLIFWLFCWIAGILIIHINFDSLSSAGSTYLIFSVTLLMDFVPRILYIKNLFSKIVHIIFCGCNVVILFISFGMILQIDHILFNESIAYIISIIVIVYMIINLVCMWLDVDITKKNGLKNSIDNEILKTMIKNFNSGELGEVHKEEK